MLKDKTNKDLLDLLNKSGNNLVKTSEYEIFKSKLDNEDLSKLDKFFNTFKEEISGIQENDFNLLVNDFKEALPLVYLKSNSLAQALERLDFRRFHSFYKDSNTRFIDDNIFSSNDISILTVKLRFNPIESILQYALNIVNTKLSLFGLSYDNKSRIIVKSRRFSLNTTDVKIENNVSVLILEGDKLTIKFNNRITDHYASIMFINTLLANYFKLLGKFHDRTNKYVIQITDQRLTLECPIKIDLFVPQGNFNLKYSEDIEPDYIKYSEVFSDNNREENNDYYIQRNMVTYSIDSFRDDSLIINEIEVSLSEILNQAIKEYRLDIPNTNVNTINIIKYNDKEFITTRIKN